MPFIDPSAERESVQVVDVDENGDDAAPSPKFVSHMPLPGGVALPTMGSPQRVRRLAAERRDASPALSPRHGAPAGSPRGVTIGLQCRAWLTCRAAPSRKIPLPADEGPLFSIGRACSCSLQVVSGSEVSRVHCCIRYTSEPTPSYTL
eukprot:Hpha_TRINITY_DN14543_c0_g3::TRINITY_DN14543_c0_g3_i1::g.46550::m.46550